MASEHAVFSNVSGVVPEKSASHLYRLERNDSELHFHKVIEIGLCTEGCGTSVTSELTHAFCAGDIHVVFPFQPHRNYAESNDCLWKWIFIDPYQYGVRFGSSQSAMTELMEKIHVYGIIKKADFPVLHAALAALIDEIDAPPRPFRNDRIFARLMLLLTDMTEIASDAPAVAIPTRFHSISASLLLLEGCLTRGEQPTVPELAASCQMPISSFRRIFTEVMGVSPKQHVAVCAVQHAARLLITTTHSVTAIAGMAGFPELSTFNRSFKNITGMSPIEYKKRILSDFA